jgi:hypothetical protein
MIGMQKDDYKLLAHCRLLQMLLKHMNHEKKGPTCPYSPNEEPWETVSEIKYMEAHLIYTDQALRWYPQSSLYLSG